MKVNLTVALMALNGTEVKDEKDVTVIIKDLCINALMAEGADKVDGVEKFKRFKLAERVYAEKGEIELTVEEAAQIKGLVSAIYTPLVVGRVYSILEG